jgi:hypothetical protein
VPKNAPKRGAAAIEEDADGGGDNIYEGGDTSAGKGAVEDPEICE